MTDISLTVQSSLVTDMFDAIKFPYRVRLDANKSRDEEQGIDLAWVEDAALSDDFDPEAEFDDALDDMIEQFLDHTKQGGEESGTQDPEAEALIAPYVEGITNADRSDVSTIRNRMAEDDEFGEKFSAFAKQRVKADVDWVEIEVGKRPSAAMGNPLTIGGLEIRVRARVKACLRAFGKWWCTPWFKTPWFLFEGERASLFLDVVATKVYGRGQVKNIDFVIKIKIFKWTVKIKIGITGIINGQLGKQRVLLMDLDDVKVKVPGVGLTYAITSVDIPSSNSATQVLLDGRFS